MFSERLENLIQAALQDGILTDQEKSAIIKRAEAEGEDINEVDIYIQSLMQERQQQLAKERQEAETARIVAQKKEREARMASEMEEQKQRDTLIRKCPVCGAIIPALTNVCPGCNHVINSNKADEEAMKLMREILIASNHMDVSWEGNFCPDEDSYDNYFPMLAELESLYGKLPKVQEFLLDEKKKRLKKLSKAFVEWADIPSPFDADDCRKFAEACLKTIINEYGSMPEAQALIPDYKEKLEIMKKKEKKEKTSGWFKKLGCLIVIIIVIALLCLPQISKFLKGSISTEKDHVEASSLVMDDSENEDETDEMDDDDERIQDFESEDEIDEMDDADERIQERAEQQMERARRKAERMQERAEQQMERARRERERRK